MYFLYNSILLHHSLIDRKKKSVFHQRSLSPDEPHFRGFLISHAGLLSVLGFLNLYTTSGQGMAWSGAWIITTLFLSLLDTWKENKQANKYSCVNANVNGCLATNDYRLPAQWKHRCSRLVNWAIKHSGAGGNPTEESPEAKEWKERGLIREVLTHEQVTIPIIIFSLVLYLQNCLCSVFSPFPWQAGLICTVFLSESLVWSRWQFSSLTDQAKAFRKVEENKHLRSPDQHLKIY